MLAYVPALVLAKDRDSQRMKCKERNYTGRSGCSDTTEDSARQSDSQPAQ
jgi:hypothetical protein